MNSPINRRRAQPVFSPINKTDTTSTPMEKAMTTEVTPTAPEIEASKTNDEVNTAQILLGRLKEAGIEQISRKQWLALRKVAALQIDPNTAEVMWVYADALIYTCGAIGIPEREFYARSPGSEEWVRFRDLLPPVRSQLIKKHFPDFRERDLATGTSAEEYEAGRRAAARHQGRSATVQETSGGRGDHASEACL
jgi:hypothetical protein